MGFNQWVFDGGSALGIRYQALGTRHWELGTSPTLVGMGDSKINLKRFIRTILSWAARKRAESEGSDRIYNFPVSSV